MTEAEAIEIIRRKWDGNDGCRSCGWRSCLYEFGPLEAYVGDAELAQGFVDLPCFSEDASENGGHRGARVYLTDPNAGGSQS